MNRRTCLKSVVLGAVACFLPRPEKSKAPLVFTKADLAGRASDWGFAQVQDLQYKCIYDYSVIKADV